MRSKALAAVGGLGAAELLPNAPDSILVRALSAACSASGVTGRNSGAGPSGSAAAGVLPLARLPIPEVQRGGPGKDLGRTWIAVTASHG